MQCHHELNSKHRPWTQSLFPSWQTHTNLKSMVNYMLTERVESIFQTFRTFLLHKLLKSFSLYWVPIISGYRHIKQTRTVLLKVKAFLCRRATILPPISGPVRSGWILTQRLAVPHVIGTGSAQVGPLHEQIGEPVQAEAGGQGADEAVETP